METLGESPVNQKKNMTYIFFKSKEQCEGECATCIYAAVTKLPERTTERKKDLFLSLFFRGFCRDHLAPCTMTVRAHGQGYCLGWIGNRKTESDRILCIILQVMSLVINFFQSGFHFVSKLLKKKKRQLPCFYWKSGDCLGSGLPPGAILKFRGTAGRSRHANGWSLRWESLPW